MHGLCTDRTSPRSNTVENETVLCNHQIRVAEKLDRWESVGLLADGWILRPLGLIDRHFPCSRFSLSAISNIG